MDTYSEKQPSLIPVLVVLVIAAMLYSWILPQRWVTPDEGAHMMSAWRIHYGEVPLADYGSRQPLYTYIHAFSQVFFDNTLIAGRLVSLLSTLAAGLLVFLIGRTIQGAVIGTVAAAMFLFSPLTLEYATVVQTQPVVILLECAAVLILLNRESSWWLALVGVLLACAFYVRESSMAVTLAAVLWLFFMRGGSRTLLRQIIPLLAGYLVVVIVVVLTYSQWLTLYEIWRSPINPLRLAVGALSAFIPSDSTDTMLSMAPAGPVEVMTDNTIGRPPSVSYLYLGMQFIAMILIAAAGTLIMRLRGLVGRPVEGDGSKFWFLVFWLLSLAALYGLHFKTRGFFPGYLREFEPALAILAAIGLTAAVRSIGVRQALVLVVPVLVVVLFPVVVVSGMLPFWVESFTLSICSGFAVLILLSYSDVPWRKLIPLLTITGVILGTVFFLRRGGAPLAEASVMVLVFTGIILLVIAGMLLRWSGVEKVGPRLLLAASAFGLASSIAVVAEKGGFDFQSRWSIPVVKKVTEAIEANTEADDEVMSGGVIWAYLADRYPYMKQNHPLGFFEVKADDEQANSFYQYYLEKPPAIVVLDGYTKKTWYKSSRLKAAVDEDYSPLIELDETMKVDVLIHHSKTIP